MGRQEKLLARLQSVPKDFTWDELKSLLGTYGYKLLNSKRGGSRRKFYCAETGSVISLHEPHPQNIIKEYVIKDVIENLKNAGVI